jgi:hypothetical protein
VEREGIRVLKPEGKLVVTTPKFSSFGQRMFGMRSRTPTPSRRSCDPPKQKDFETFPPNLNNRLRIEGLAVQLFEQMFQRFNESIGKQDVLIESKPISRGDIQ